MGQMKNAASCHCNLLPENVAKNLINKLVKNLTVQDLDYIVQLVIKRYASSIVKLTTLDTTSSERK